MGVTIATTRVAAQVAGGVQTITTAKLGGLTPVAMWITAGYGIADGVAADHFGLGFGAATGVSDQWAIFAQAEHGQGTTDTDRRGMTDEAVCVLTQGTANVDGEAAFTAWVANGAQITWGNAPSAGWYLHVTFWAGTDLSALADTVLIGNQNVDTVVNTLSFRPSVLLVTSANKVLSDTGATTAMLSHGVVVDTDPIEQYSWCWRSENGQAASTQYARLSDEYGAMQGHWGAPGPSWGAEFSAITDVGFTATPRLGNANDDLGYLALNFNGVKEFAAGLDVTPLATGATARPGANLAFKPDYMQLGLTQMPAVNQEYTNANAGSIGVAILDATDQYCMSAQDEVGAGTTNTQSISDDQAINLPDDDGTAAHQASLVSFYDGGWNLDYGATEGTAVYMWYLAIGEIVAAVPSYPGAYIEEVEFIAPDGLIMKPAGFEDVDVLKEQFR